MLNFEISEEIIQWKEYRIKQINLEILELEGLEKILVLKVQQYI